MQMRVREQLEAPTVYPPELLAARARRAGIKNRGSDSIENLLDNGILDEFPLAQGGMIKVYACPEDPDLVLKVLKDPNHKRIVAQGAYLQRNVSCQLWGERLRGNLALAQVPEPFVIHSDNNKLYILEQRVHGGTLWDCKDNLTPQDILYIGLQTARTINEFSALKTPLIHRDIKPLNMMLGNDGTVHLIDFSLASPAGKTKYNNGGTLGYLPPSTFSGKSPTAFDDLFGLAMTLHACLSRSHPFKITQRSSHEQISQIRRGEIFTPRTYFSTPEEKEANQHAAITLLDFITGVLNVAYGPRNISFGDGKKIGEIANAISYLESQAHFFKKESAQERIRQVVGTKPQESRLYEYNLPDHPLLEQRAYEQTEIESSGGLSALDALIDSQISNGRTYDLDEANPFARTRNINPLGSDLAFY